MHPSIHSLPDPLQPKPPPAHAPHPAPAQQPTENEKTQDGDENIDMEKCTGRKEW